MNQTDTITIGQAIRLGEGGSTPKKCTHIRREIAKNLDVLAELADYPNPFLNYLLDVPGVEVADVFRVIDDYCITPTKEGATIFWNIEGERGRVCDGLIVYHDGEGRRAPDRTPYWVHSTLQLFADDMQDCLFGEHLLKYTENQGKPIAFVEGQETAVIASLLMPSVVWTATPCLHTLNERQCRILDGLDVSVFPNANEVTTWARKVARWKDIDTTNWRLQTDWIDKARAMVPGKDRITIADYLLAAARGMTREAATNQEPTAEDPQLIIEEFEPKFAEIARRLQIGRIPEPLRCLIEGLDLEPTG